MIKYEIIGGLFYDKRKKSMEEILWLCLYFGGDYLQIISKRESNWFFEELILCEVVVISKIIRYHAQLILLCD